jgi:uncharacterized membrane protein
MEYWRLIAHNHWLTLRILNKEVRLCARCSGYLVGFFALTALRKFLGLTIAHNLNIQFQLSLCVLFIIPLTYDWLTQSWGWRESNNGLRLLTGAILGVGVSLLSAIEMAPYLKKLMFVYIAILIVLVGYVGERLYGFLSHSRRI